MTNTKSSWWLAVAIALLFCVAIGPTLSWLQFCNSMENLNVATALELRRDHPIESLADWRSWLTPTLEGRPRIEKPPLTAWITALAIRSSTLSQLDDRDEVARAHAYESFAFEVRLPALIISALIIVVTFFLGRAVIDSRAGVIAAGICATNYFFLRFSRFTTTDIQLTLWVTLANVFLASAVLDGVNWRNAICGGIALGLAFMTKGPVAFVQSIVPALLFVAARAIFNPQSTIRNPRSWPALTVGILLMLLIASSWYAIIAHHDPHVLKIWFSETNPGGADRLRSDNPFMYLLIILFMVPWVLFLIDGLIRGAMNRPFSRAMYPAFTLLVVLIIMTCFHDRKDRYILPMVPIASLIAAQSVVATLDRARWSIPAVVHWIFLVGVALAMFLGTDPRVLKTVDGQPWFSLATASTAAGIGLVIVLIGWLASKRWRASFVATTVVLMLVLQIFGVQGYAKSREGRSEMLPLAQAIRRELPDALIYNWRRDGVVKRASVDLSIYLNRITRWIPDPASLPRTDRPQIYLALHERGESEPAPAAGWEFFAAAKHDKDWYVAFVRDGISPSPAGKGPG